MPRRPHIARQLNTRYVAHWRRNSASVSIREHWLHSSKGYRVRHFEVVTLDEGETIGAFIERVEKRVAQLNDDVAPPRKLKEAA